MDELAGSSERDERLRQLQQELETARATGHRQLEHMAARARLLDSELAAARAQSTQMISLQQVRCISTCLHPYPQMRINFMRKHTISCAFVSSYES